MILYFTYDQTKFFIETCKKNILFGLKAEAPISDEYQDEFDIRTRKINQFHKNIWVYSASPIKIWVMILNIIHKLTLKFSEVEYISKDVNFYYSTYIR